jgi:hypothetical protein
MTSVANLDAVTIFSSDTKVDDVPDVGEDGYGYSCATGYYYDKCTQLCTSVIICDND